MAGPATARAAQRLLPHRRPGGHRHPAARGQELLRHCCRTTSGATPSRCPTFMDADGREGAARQQVEAGLLQEDQGARSRRPSSTTGRPASTGRRSGRSSPRWRRPRGSTTRSRGCGPCWRARTRPPSWPGATCATRSSTPSTGSRRSADDYAGVDDAMRWGFNWELGPFEMLDAIGVAEFVKRAEADGVAVPPRLRSVDRFYVDEGSRRRTRDPATLAWRDVVASRRAASTSCSSRRAGPRWSGTPAPRSSTWATASSAWSSTPR